MFGCPRSRLCNLGTIAYPYSLSVRRSSIVANVSIRWRYYRLLQEVRERGAWEAWLELFLDGVAETANQAFDIACTVTAGLDTHLVNHSRIRPMLPELFLYGRPAGNRPQEIFSQEALKSG